MNPPNFWGDTLERALTTGAQALVMYVIVAMQGDGVVWKAAVAAIFPVVLTVLLNAVTTWTAPITNYWADLIYRTGRTFLTVFLGALVADSFNLWNVTDWRTAFVLAGSAVLVFLKGELARRRTSKQPGSPITPISFLTL